MVEAVDTLVVGARCAGAPLSLSLARAGQRVLLVDAAALPADQPLSTHYIQPYGMKILDDLGLGDQVRELAPPLPANIVGVGDVIVRVEFNGKARGSCPRRHDLDRLLLEAARAAGAKVETGVRVVDLLRDGERVVGAVLDERGKRREIRSKVVVGADGPHSTVAKVTGATEYYGYEAERATYWAYWPRPADYETAEPYRGGSAMLYRGSDLYFMFPANREQLLAGLAFPTEYLGEWRGRQRELLLERLRAFPLIAPLVQGEPISEVRGIVKARFFFRQATGPGWALVGDAGLFKDPAGALGISDALRDSQALSRALLQGTEAALERYWRQRDIDSLALFDLARSCGAADYDNPLNRVIFGRLAQNELLRGRIVKVMTREIPPSRLLSPGQVLGWTFGALCKGQFGILKPLLAAAQSGARLQKELRIRTELLNACS